MSRIEVLINAMTLAEKLGQLTMTAAGYTVTGPVIAEDSTEAIKAGRSAICSTCSVRTVCARCSGWRSRSQDCAYRYS